ncbi:MAG: 3-keto-5-aminohexanoate cleavage protein [Alphaproteobacteria bacterium]|nr:3-keto-5-aminohexanoate cleavage protein [Alphaproteobacteria bacterium]
MNTDVFITCAVTGAGDTTEKSPHVPVTPEAIANAAIEAARAGAAIAHIHVRDVTTGKGNRDRDAFREVVARVRDSECDVIINLTTGMGGDYVPDADDPGRASPGSDMTSPEERVLHVEELLPEICSLDVATMNFTDGAFINVPDHLRVMGERIAKAGVKPELECFDLGHVRLANQLITEGVIEEPPLFQICLGVPWGAPADPESLIAMRNLLPKNAHWSAFGISRMQIPMAAQAVISGGNVRVGLEDNLYLSRGVLATNGQLVERAVEVVERLGARIMSPAETRQKLSLTKQF